MLRPPHVHRSLNSIAERVARARDELRILDEQIAFQLDVLEEAKTRMLVSETPLADRAFRIARDDYERMARERDRAASELVRLQAEQDSLLDRMLD